MSFLLRFKIGLVLMVFVPISLQAATTTFERAGFQISIEPILAYEFTQVNAPTIHTRGMLLYGARVTAGHKLVSGEGEYTLGTVNETFPGLDKNLKTDKQNARLGIRSAITAAPGLDVILRVGGQATKVKTQTTTVTTATTLTIEQDWDIHPYAGAGLQAHLLKSVSIALEATYLFRSVKDWSQNDVQTAASVKINLPTH